MILLGLSLKLKLRGGFGGFNINQLANVDNVNIQDRCKPIVVLVCEREELHKLKELFSSIHFLYLVNFALMSICHHSFHFRCHHKLVS